MNSQKLNSTIWKPKKIAKTKKSEFIEKFIVAHTCFWFLAFIWSYESHKNTKLDVLESLEGGLQRF